MHWCPLSRDDARQRVHEKPKAMTRFCSPRWCLGDLWSAARRPRTWLTGFLPPSSSQSTCLAAFRGRGCPRCSSKHCGLPGTCRRQDTRRSGGRGGGRGSTGHEYTPNNWAIWCGLGGRVVSSSWNSFGNGRTARYMLAPGSTAICDKICTQAPASVFSFLWAPDNRCRRSGGRTAST